MKEFLIKLTNSYYEKCNKKTRGSLESYKRQGLNDVIKNKKKVLQVQTKNYAVPTKGEYLCIHEGLS